MSQETETVTLSIDLFNQLLSGYGAAVTLNQGFTLLENIKADVQKRLKANVQPIEAMTDKQ